MSKENRIQLINSKPTFERNEKCPACGNAYKVTKSSPPSFNDEIESVVQVYGFDIFAGDDIATIIKKIVKTRNKMLHVDAEKKGALNGGQCGFYMRKYVEIYRMVVMQQIKMWNTSMAEELKVKRVTGKLIIIRFENGGGIQVSENRLFDTKEATAASIQSVKSMPKKIKRNRFHSPYDYWH